MYMPDFNKIQWSMTELHMCLWNMDAPGGQNMAKSKSYFPPPMGHVMSLKCEQHLDELTVQVWLLYDHPNFKYCTL